MRKARRHGHKAAPTACRRMLSGTISLFCSKFFSPFPHGTGSLSVSREYLALPDGPGSFTQNSSCSALLRIPIRLIWFRIRGFHPLRRNFPIASARHISPTSRSYNPTSAVTDVVWALPRSLATTRGIILLFSLPPATKMFQFAGLASHADAWIPCLQHGGLSHSEIRGSKVICTSPQLIAAYHVLHRLREPRHPPCALFLLSLCPGL